MFLTSTRPGTDRGELSIRDGASLEVLSGHVVVAQQNYPNTQDDAVSCTNSTEEACKIVLLKMDFW
jgi:hypothetical protein